MMVTMNVASIFETCCGTIFIVGIALTGAILLYFRKRKEKKHLNRFSPIFLLTGWL